jgi:hypothetical protein|tara:strand:- start:305 stop:1084 length:780 start_codon:yes stop_codon:yes gene_type:complete
LYERAYDLAWQTIGNAPFDYVGYGCGDGLKDANFFGSMPSPGQLETLRLMDISASLLIEAYQRLQSLKPEAWVVNLASMSDGLFQRSETPQRPLLLSCLGMLPTLGHRHLLPFLTGQLRPGDLLLLSANLSPSSNPTGRQHILTQYDNEPAMQWYAGYLIELGLPRDGFSCRATTQDLEGVEGGFRIQVMAHLKKELSLSLSGARINWAVDDSVDLFRSERWTSNGLRILFQTHGLQCLEALESEDQEEGLYLLQVADG